MATPDQEQRRLKLNLARSEADGDDSVSSEKEAMPAPPGTPETQRKVWEEEEVSGEVFVETTPESAEKSPSSVLNPPSSLKRKTIRDYFITA